MILTLFPDFGGLGASGDRFDPTPASQEAKKTKKIRCVTPVLKPILVIFGYCAGCIFECILRCPTFPHCGRFRGGSPKGRFWETILKTFWG